MSLSAHDIRNTAERDAAHLPGLLLRAQHLANGVLLGEHGRRRPGSVMIFGNTAPFMTAKAIG